MIKQADEPIVYKIENREVYDNLVDDAMISTVPIFDQLLTRKEQINILIYGGDMDTIDGPITLEAWF